MFILLTSIMENDYFINMEQKMFYTDFGKLLESTRNDVGLTQKNLAKRVGLSRTSITNIEKGRQRIPLHMLYAFADALGVQPDKLMPQKQSEPDTIDYILDTKLKNMNIEENSMQWIKRVIESAKKGENDEEKD